MFQIQYFNVVLWTSVGLFAIVFYAIYLMIDMPLMVSESALYYAMLWYQHVLTNTLRFIGRYALVRRIRYGRNRGLRSLTITLDPFFSHTYGFSV